MKNILSKGNKSGRKELSNPEVINVLLWTVILVLPFLINPFGNDTYYFPKAIFLWIIGLMIFILLIKERKIRWSIDKKLALAFLFIIFLSTLNAINIPVSILGSRLRYEGLITYCVYIILFLAASKYLVINKSMINIILALASIMAIYGVLQYYGIDPIPRDYAHSLSVEARGFLGNRNFFGSYLTLCISLSLGIYIFKGEKKYLLNSCIIFSALLATLTRSCWLAFAVITIIGLVFIRKRKECLKRGIIVFLIFISIFSFMNVTSGNQLLGRSKTMITGINENSSSGRGVIWGICLKVINNHKLLGVGPDNLKECILNEFPEDMNYWYENHENTYIDKAHNEFIQIGVNSGIASIIIYITFILIIFNKLLKNRQDDKNKIIILIVIGYLVQSILNISVVGVAPLFWIVLGVSSRSDERNILERS